MWCARRRSRSAPRSCSRRAPAAVRPRHRRGSPPRHREILQRLQKEYLEGCVGAVDLAGQQHRRAAGLRPHRVEKRLRGQVVLGEKLGFQRVAAAQRGGENLGDLGLAGPGLAFEKQRPPQLQRQKRDRCQRPFADMVLRPSSLCTSSTEPGMSGIRILSRSPVPKVQVRRLRSTALKVAGLRRIAFSSALPGAGRDPQAGRN